MSQQSKRKNWFVTSLGVAAATALAVTLLAPISTQAGTDWHRIGNGNLDVLQQADGSYLLYPAPTTYVYGVKGSQGKEFKMGNTEAYKLTKDGDKLSAQKVASKEAKVKTPKGEKGMIQAEGRAFLTDREKTKRVKSGEVVTEAEDFSNLYLIADDGSSSRALLKNDGFEALQNKIREKNAGKGEEKQYLVWAANSHPIQGGEKVVFSSNKNTIEHGSDNYSVFVVDADGSNERVLLNSEQYGPLRIVGTSGNLVVAHNTDKHSVITTDVVTGEVKEFAIGGWSEVLSAESGKVMYRPVIDSHVQQNDLRVLDLKTGATSKVEGMPEGYFYNTGGEWSPDGTQFAFYANGLKNNSEKKMYRDNNLLVSFDTETMKIRTIGAPQGRALYPLGALHWVGEDQLLTYTDDDAAWLVDVK